MDAMSIMSATPTLFSEESTLLLAQDNPSNTVITDSETGRMVYTISTETSNRRTFTYFRDAHGEVLASSEWQPGLDQDFITIGKIKSVPFGSYFSKAMFRESVRYRIIQFELVSLYSIKFQIRVFYGT